MPGALGTRKLIEECRWNGGPLPEMSRVLIPIDPQATSGDPTRPGSSPAALPAVRAEDRRDARLRPG